eukprot:8779500-Ditylum_brightwellii.AAC.1
MKDIDAFVYSMKHGPKNFVLTDEGDINKFLGIEITDRCGVKFEMLQPHLINRILRVLGLESHGFETTANYRLTPAASQILNKDLNGEPHKKPWNYCTAV